MRVSHWSYCAASAVDREADDAGSPPIAQLNSQEGESILSSVSASSNSAFRSLSSSYETEDSSVTGGAAAIVSAEAEKARAGCRPDGVSAAVGDRIGKAKMSSSPE